MNMPPIVSPQEWEAAREELLAEEKRMTRARDALAAKRRRMPRMAVEREYRFEGPNGPASLHDVFAGRHQLIVYRFFFDPDVKGYPEKGCRGCSMVADQVAHLSHLNARDTTLVFVSRASQAEIARLKERMGWEIPWYTLTDEFDRDFGVGEWHGTNVFLHEGGEILRTYFVDKLQTATPEMFMFPVSVMILVMVVFGGIGSIWGVVLGAFILQLLQSWFLPDLSQWPHWLGRAGHVPFLERIELAQSMEMIFGIILVLMRLYRREGLIPATRHV